MHYRESADGEILLLDDDALLHRDQRHGHGRLLSAQHHAVEQVVDAFECPRAAVDLQVVDGFPAHEGGEQPGQARGCDPGDRG